MKQFQFTTRTGETLLVRNFEEATFGMSAYDRGYMAEIPVGGSMRTREGFWIRLPDIEQTSTARFLDAVSSAQEPAADVGADEQPAYDERLERIATATLQGLITGVVSVPELVAAHSAGAKQKGFTFEQYLAIDAVAMAKALIAELDKQA